MLGLHQGLLLQDELFLYRQLFFRLLLQDLLLILLFLLFGDLSLAHGLGDLLGRIDLRDQRLDNFDSQLIAFVPHRPLVLLLKVRAGRAFDEVAARVVRALQPAK